MKIPLIKGQRKTKYDYRDNLPINMVAIPGQTEDDQGYLLAHDGLTEFATTAGISRGGTFNSRFNRHFRVSGEYLESVSASGAVTNIGFIGGTSTCSFANSFNTQAVLSDGKFFLYDNATLTQISDPNLGIPIDVVQFKGIYVLTDGEFLYNTTLANEYVVSSGTDYASSEFAPDPIVGLITTDSDQLIVFNRYSCEYFYFNGSAPVGTSVLQSRPGRASRIGIVGTHCKTFLDGMVFILGGRKEESPTIRILDRGVIATREVNKLINQYTESQLSETVLESRVIDGDKYLVVHLPDYTLLYNHSAAELYGVGVAWTIVKTGQDSPWRGKFGVFDPRISKWVYGDKQEAKLALLDDESFAQYGEAQEALFYTPIIPVKQAIITDLEVDTIKGFAPGNVDVAMSMSYDAVTWGKEYWYTVSEPDNYNTRYRLRRLGYVSDDMSFRFRFVSTGKMAFSGLTINEP